MPNFLSSTVSAYTTDTLLQSRKLTAACSFLYTKRNSRTLRVVGCNRYHIFVQILTARHNLTVEYIDFDKGLKDKVTMYYSKIYLGAARYRKYELNAEYPFIELGKKLKFLYCTEKVRRENFSFLFWLTAFDINSWISVGITLLALIIFFKGKWFDIFGALLMRQQFPHIESNKLMLLVMLVSIILTYGYEGIISSKIIVPQPITVFNNLRDLINNGYKFYWVNPRAGKSESQYLFRKENITNDELDSSVVNVSYDNFKEFGFIQSTLAECNSTFTILDDNGLYYMKSVMFEDYNVNCQVLNDVAHEKLLMHQMLGFGKLELSKTAELIKESGIINFL